MRTSCGCFYRQPRNTQCAASSCAARCISHRSALHQPSQRAALPIVPPSVFRSIAERDSVELLSENKAVQSVNRHKPSSARKEILSPPQYKAHRSNVHQPEQNSGLQCPFRSITVRHSFRSFVLIAPAQFLIQNSAFQITSLNVLN